jgi:hypothetical protein
MAPAKSLDSKEENKMAISLLEIRTAATEYLQNKVSVRVSPLVADVPVAISPTEGFTFSITATNATFGGIPLVQVSYELRVANPAVAKLIVPPVTTAVARTGSNTNYPSLTPGTEVDAMHLFPSDQKLGLGDSDTITGLRGKAKALGVTNIAFSIHADLDLDYIFYKDGSSSVFTRTVTVV